MLMLDKKNVIASLDNRYPVTIELGCGSRKRHPEAIGIDLLDAPCVDIVGDVYEVLERFNTGSVSQVYSYHFIEHISDVFRLMKELERIVKPGGRVELVAPHFSNPHFYSDPTHQKFFGLYTLCYLATGSPFLRQVPNYNMNLKFRIEKVDLIFKSSPPFYVRHGFKVLLGSVFNSCNYMKEFYEENLCYIFPCYEVRYRIGRIAE
jgi:SAM-dependent methyltransferase